VDAAIGDEDDDMLNNGLPPHNECKSIDEDSEEDDCIQIKGAVIHHESSSKPGIQHFRKGQSGGPCTSVKDALSKVFQKKSNGLVRNACNVWVDTKHGEESFDATEAIENHPRPLLTNGRIVFRFRTVRPTPAAGPIVIVPEDTGECTLDDHSGEGITTPQSVCLLLPYFWSDTL
jgi:hypothetical protein